MWVADIYTLYSTLYIIHYDLCLHVDCSRLVVSHLVWGKEIQNIKS